MYDSLFFHDNQALKYWNTYVDFFVDSWKAAGLQLLRIFFQLLSFFSIHFYLFDHFVFFLNVVRSAAFQDCLFFLICFIFFIFCFSGCFFFRCTSLKTADLQCLRIFLCFVLYSFFSLKSCRPTAFKDFLFFFVLYLFFSLKAADLQLLRIFFFLKHCRPTAFCDFFLFFVLYSFFFPLKICRPTAFKDFFISLAVWQQCWVFGTFWWKNDYVNNINITKEANRHTGWQKNTYKIQTGCICSLPKTLNRHNYWFLKIHWFYIESDP